LTVLGEQRADLVFECIVQKKLGCLNGVKLADICCESSRVSRLLAGSRGNGPRSSLRSIDEVALLARLVEARSIVVSFRIISEHSNTAVDLQAGSNDEPCDQFSVATSTHKLSLRRQGDKTLNVQLSASSPASV
jgi:hypothetical protein